MLIFLLLSAFSSFGPPMERLPRVSRLRFLFPGLPCAFPLLDIRSYWPPKTKFPPRELRVSPAYVCNPREIHTVWIYVCGKFSRINPRLTRSSKQELASLLMDLALFPTYLILARALGVFRWQTRVDNAEAADMMRGSKARRISAGVCLLFIYFRRQLARKRGRFAREQRINQNRPRWKF